MGLRAGLERWGKSHPHRDSIPGPSSPQRVAIPTDLSRTNCLPDDEHTMFETCRRHQELKYEKCTFCWLRHIIVSQCTVQTTYSSLIICIRFGQASAVSSAVGVNSRTNIVNTACVFFAPTTFCALGAQCQTNQLRHTVLRSSYQTFLRITSDNPLLPV